MAQAAPAMLEALKDIECKANLMGAIVESAGAQEGCAMIARAARAALANAEERP